MKRNTIQTDTAPAAIGTYSQAVTLGDLVFISGQIGLDPNTMELVDQNFEAQAQQAFDNLANVATAAGSDLNHALKITVYLTNLDNFESVNKIMGAMLNKPYPARAAVGVAELPKKADIEVDAILAPLSG